MPDDVGLSARRWRQIMAGRPSNAPLWILVAVFVGLPLLCCAISCFWPSLAIINVVPEQLRQR
jgi:hypothetical protein